jgi:hypothetical protein
MSKSKISISNISFRPFDEFNGIVYFDLEYEEKKEGIYVLASKIFTELQDGEIKYNWEVDTNRFKSNIYFNPEEEYSILDDTLYKGITDNEQRRNFRLEVSKQLIKFMENENVQI